MKDENPSSRMLRQAELIVLISAPSPTAPLEVIQVLKSFTIALSKSHTD